MVTSYVVAEPIRCLQDKVAEIQNEVFGYGDSSLLKISGPDFDTRL